MKPTDMTPALITLILTLIGGALIFNPLFPLRAVAIGVFLAVIAHKTAARSWITKNLFPQREPTFRDFGITVIVMTPAVLWPMLVGVLGGNDYLGDNFIFLSTFLLTFIVANLTED